MRKQNSLPQTSLRRPNRRGMSLLFVLSLILFITLLATSFVVVSTQFSRSSKIRTRLDARGDSSRQLVERAFYDLVRGPDPNNVNSVLRTHGILEDMYGYGFSARITAAANVAANDVPGALEVCLTPLLDLRPDETPDAAQPLSPIPGAYNGRVLTFTSGPLNGTSVRIIRYSGNQNGDYTNAPFAFTLYREKSRDEIASFTQLVTQQTKVIVNGPAYQGWGAGLANLATNPNEALQANRVGLPIGDFNRTGPNESYDAPDFQNVFLSAVDYNSDGNPDVSRIVPAFERAELPAASNFRAFGTPADPLNVDNNGDGIEDSIWVDAGYPIQTDIDGRRYKPLVSYLVLDMDGRFNVNAHDNFFSIYSTPQNVKNRAVSNGGVNLLGDVNSTIQQPGAPNELPRGQYLGPPEISMSPSLFDVGQPDYQQLVLSRYGEDQEPGSSLYRDSWARVEMFGHPDIANPDNDYQNNPFVGGLYGTLMDIHGRFGRGIPNSFQNSADLLGPDSPFGSGNIGDPVGPGVPVFLPQADATSILDNPENEIRNSAYEFSLMPESRYATLSPDAANTDFSDDQPYTAKEIERILRKYDRDSGSLPSRLAEIYGNRDANLIGHSSFETPSISGFVPDPTLINPDTGERPEQGRDLPVSIVERVYNLLVHNQPSPVDRVAVANMTQILLSPDLRMGLPFDINRPFGDGRDNDGDWIFDEPSELGATPQQLATVNGNLQNMSVNQFSRQVFARHLYVLALLATGDTGIITPNTSAGSGGLTDPDTIRRMTLAQWAINVVDFRDSDSICTPFEFDFNPFDENGWDADGDLSTPHGADTSVVWGCERPEILLSESVAFHDRRTQDTGDDVQGEVGSSPPNEDDDFDSRLVPHASVFFELYRPWSQSTGNQLVPRELQPEVNAPDFPGPNEEGIDLTLNVAGDPVWRLMVTTEGNLTTKWKDIGSAQGNMDDIDEKEIFRRIYFVQPSENVEPSNPPADEPKTRHKAYWPDPEAASRVAGNSYLQPGGYAVVGSAGQATGQGEHRFGLYDTWFGRRTESDWDNRLNSTRGVTLIPESQQVVVRSGSPEPVALTFPAVAIPINQTMDRATQNSVSRSVGISDPIRGYYDYVNPSNDVEPGTDPDPDGIIDPDGYRYIQTKDVPVDMRLSEGGRQSDDPTDRTSDIIMSNTPAVKYRSVYLQRLADPTIPYHPTLNPYLTIDAQFIDLTCFNGVENDLSQVGGSPPTSFVSNERGRVNNRDVTSSAQVNDDLNKRRALWPIESPEDVRTQTAYPADTHHFSQPFYGSLGQLNRAYDHPDFVGKAVGFGGLTWNNRPFANRMELLDVPFTNSTELLRSPDGLQGFGATDAQPGGYTLDRLAIQSGGGSPYEPTISTAQNPYPVRGGQFGHLLNFFAEDVTQPTEPRNLVNLLDFVDVPSRFPGTRVHLYSDNLRPPFNLLSRYREPGKINVNTCLNNRVLQGWWGAIGETFEVGLYGNAGVSKAAFEGSRRNASLDGFQNPFRRAIEFDKSPFALQDPVQSGLLRSSSNAQSTPVFNTDCLNPGTLDPNYLAWANPSRESTNRFETLRRIGATTTTRSSVFAIWITVGRFEVGADGELLKPVVGTVETGVELGADEGKNKRSRGFYLIDRSIPVGFEPGVNHNVEDIILAETIMD